MPVPFVTPAKAGAQMSHRVPAFAGMTKLFAVLLFFLVAAPAFAQTFPQLTGRVVDQANLLSPEQKLDLSSRSAALEAASGRQFVIATVNSLEGRPIEDYGYRLGRAWGIGQKGKDDGVILLVAPNEKKVRIETGYGARVFLTDAVSSIIIRNVILPKFRQGDMAGGIMAGAQAIVTQMSLPPDQARQTIVRAEQQEKARADQRPGIIPVLFWMILFFVVIGSLARRARGRRYGGWGPVMLWGPGWGGGGSSGFGGGWGGGGGGGGFSGGGGSFGGGGASGGW